MNRSDSCEDYTESSPEDMEDNYHQRTSKDNYDNSAGLKTRKSSIGYDLPPKVNLYSDNILQEEETTENIDRGSIADLSNIRQNWENKTVQSLKESQPVVKKSNKVVRHWSVKLSKPLGKPSPNKEFVIPDSSYSHESMNSFLEAADETKSAIELEIQQSLEREEALKRELELRLLRQEKDRENGGEENSYQNSHSNNNSNNSNSSNHHHHHHHSDNNSHHNNSNNHSDECFQPTYLEMTEADRAHEISKRENQFSKSKNHFNNSNNSNSNSSNSNSNSNSSNSNSNNSNSNSNDTQKLDRDTEQSSEPMKTPMEYRETAVQREIRLQQEREREYTMESQHKNNNNSNNNSSSSNNSNNNSSSSNNSNNNSSSSSNNSNNISSNSNNSSSSNNNSNSNNSNNNSSNSNNSSSSNNNSSSSNNSSSNDNVDSALTRNVHSPCSASEDEDYTDEHKYNAKKIVQELMEVRQKEAKLREMRQSILENKTSKSNKDDGVSEVKENKPCIPEAKTSDSSSKSGASGPNVNGNETNVKEIIIIKTKKTAPVEGTVDAASDNTVTDGTQTITKKSNETPIEREIRLAQERENQLRIEKGVPIVKKPAVVSDPGSQVPMKPMFSLKPAAGKVTMMKKFASIRLQEEIKKEVKREMSLRKSGRINTTSEERVGEQKKYVEVAPAPRQRNFPASRTPSVASTDSNPGDFDDVDGLTVTPPPTETTKPSKPNGPNYVLQKPKVSATFSYREARTSAGSLIEKELREMKEREKELREMKERENELKNQVVTSQPTITENSEA